MKKNPLFPFIVPVYPVPTYTKWCIHCNQPITQGQSYRAVHRNGADEDYAHMDCAIKHQSEKGE